ncbi:MFS transporter [Elioraea sp.]|uniref:MFS transporter n=1 Tax=Elioraea sp. TaxID=2185103 RepID=UPI0021DE2546|nr:MFS transporter [Elioraea sp.]GIX11026.1 MAG: MFS transporter [Elioraea sp.]
MTAIRALGALVGAVSLSQWARTLPAVIAGGVTGEFGLSEAGLAAATAMVHLGFAVGQVPSGVALDRVGPRLTASVLLAIAAAGLALSAAAPGAWSFALGQFLTGLGCSGVFMAALMVAAQLLPADRFGQVAGLMPALSGIGLLASGTPSAWLIGSAGWRAAPAAAAVAGVLCLIAAWRLVPAIGSRRHGRQGLGSECLEVLLLAASRGLRAPVTLAFVGYPATLALRGLWAGPWLTDRLGFGLVATGNVLAALSVVMSLAPALFGWLDRHLPNRARVVGIAHLAAAASLAWLPLAGGGAAPDIAAMMLVGMLIGSHVLLYPMTREAAPEGATGKALSAVNLSFFVGLVVLQPLSGLAARLAGLPGALAVFAVALAAGSAAFLALARQSR